MSIVPDDRPPDCPPDRLPPGGWAPLALALLWGLFVWVGVSSAYVVARGLSAAPAGPSATGPATAEAAPVPPPSPPAADRDLVTLPPRDVAFLATVPHLAAFVALISVDFLLYGGRLTSLGLGARDLPGGLWSGLVTGVAVIPLVFGAAILTEWVYRAIDYTHPDAHDLLRVLRRSGEPMTRIFIIAGATLVAPLAEELMFRGHLQTILRRAFARPSTGGGGVSLVASWGAIVVASAMFAVVHPAWTWPPIFLLSLCLGWLYERTGNLWAPIALHAAFNAVSTLIFLTWGG